MGSVSIRMVVCAQWALSHCVRLACPHLFPSSGSYAWALWSTAVVASTDVAANRSANQDTMNYCGGVAFDWHGRQLLARPPRLHDVLPLPATSLGGTRPIHRHVLLDCCSSLQQLSGDTWMVDSAAAARRGDEPTAQRHCYLARMARVLSPPHIRLCRG